MQLKALLKEVVHIGVALTWNEHCIAVIAVLPGTAGIEWIHDSWILYGVMIERYIPLSFKWPNKNSQNHYWLVVKQTHLKNMSSSIGMMIPN